MSDRAKIGVFGGTFNPVHHGHLRLALDLVQQLAFDQMRLVPCHIPVHRADPDVASRRRADMVELAVAGAESLAMDDRELRRGSDSYTVDTLSQLREQCGPDTSLVLIVGLDAYLGLMRWHRWQDLLTLAHILVVDRPGWQMPDEGELAEFDRRHRQGPAAIESAPAGAVVHLAVRELAISATEIRDLCARGASTQYLLPDSVRRYIARHGLYGAGA